MKPRCRERDAATVLVIDDDQEMRAVLRDFLEREGHRVIEESSGEGAIATTALERVDAVILDKEMPGIHGFEFLSFLRRRWPDMPVILITAFGGSRVAEEAFHRGATRYLEKPFRVAELLGAVRTVIEEARVASPSPGASAAKDEEDPAS